MNDEFDKEVDKNSNYENWKKYYELTIKEIELDIAKLLGRLYAANYEMKLFEKLKELLQEHEEEK